MATTPLPRNLLEAIRYFSDPNLAFSFNERDQDDLGRMKTVVGRAAGCRITYADLTQARRIPPYGWTPGV